MANILIIDDDKSIQRLICEEMKDHGCDDGILIFASSGLEGIEKYRLNQPKYVFLDMRMIGMSGATVFKHIKAIDPSAVVFLMTGYRDDNEINDMIHNGLDGYIAKQGDYVKLLVNIILSLIYAPE